MSEKNDNSREELENEKINGKLHDAEIGKNFEELTEEEMKDSQGSGDVEGETTPITSSFPCGAGISASIGWVLSVKHC